MQVVICEFILITYNLKINYFLNLRKTQQGEHPTNTRTNIKQATGKSISAQIHFGCAHNQINGQCTNSTPPIGMTQSKKSSAAPLERTLTYRLHRLHKLTDAQSQQAYPTQAGLSLSDGRCLASIGHFEPLSVKDLAQRANLNKSQASRAAQSLVEQGLVHKVDHPDDGRGVVLSLTARGRESFQKTMALIAQRNEAIFGCLSAREQTHLSALFDRLIAHAR